MRDTGSHLWLTFDRNRMFRDVWLPIVAPGHDFSDMSLPLLRDLYPGVYRYGPYAADWLAWVTAIVERVERDMSPMSDPNQTFMTMLQRTYGSHGDISQALHGFETPAGRHYLPMPFNNTKISWLQDVWSIERDSDFEALVWRVYAAGGAFLGFDDLKQSLRNAATVILLRYLPISPGSKLGRKRVLALHAQFCDLYGLPPAK